MSEVSSMTEKELTRMVQIIHGVIEGAKRNVQEYGDLGHKDLRHIANCQASGMEIIKNIVETAIKDSRAQKEAHIRINGYIPANY